MRYMALNLLLWVLFLLLPRWHGGKEYCCQGRRRKFIHWIGKVPWSRKWQLAQVFLLENSMDRAAWWATVHGVTKSQTPVGDWTCTHTFLSFYSPTFSWYLLFCATHHLHSRSKRWAGLCQISLPSRHTVLLIHKLHCPVKVSFSTIVQI